MHNERTDENSVRAALSRVKRREVRLFDVRYSKNTRVFSERRTSPLWYPFCMKSGMRSIKGAVTSQTAKNALVGTGLFGAGEIGAACALGCLLIWLVLATVIVLLWALVALLASFL